MNENFPTDFLSINKRLNQIQPIHYCSNRNFIDGDVTYLSPYIARGVISTKNIYNHLKNSGIDLKQIEKFIQELAWRDYWQRVWQEKNIDTDLKNNQTGFSHYGIPTAIIEAKTGIEVIDQALNSFSETGYLHNHLRMYISSIITNVGAAYWKHPAQWMYYHLLDGDWASNALSWQWVCGANSNKKYFANQENINLFCKGSQLGTFLDKSNDDFENFEVPNELRKVTNLALKTTLPKNKKCLLDDRKIALYTWYNMDPTWRKEDDLNRVLLLEPSHFERYPISAKSMNFLLSLCQNIDDIQLFVGEFQELKKSNPNNIFVFKEHPTNGHFEGIEDQRDWLSSVTGYYPSFFSFWKKVAKEIY